MRFPASSSWFAEATLFRRAVAEDDPTFWLVARTCTRFTAEDVDNPLITR
jgi:hypothetical protein